MVLPVSTFQQVLVIELVGEQRVCGRPRYGRLQGTFQQGAQELAGLALLFRFRERLQLCNQAKGFGDSRHK